MIDLHCHLDLFPQPAEIVAQAAVRNSFVLSVTTTPSAWPGTSALAREYLTIETALGLHPQLAKERFRELELFDKYLVETSWVGEVGLDGSPEYRGFWTEQLQAIEYILGACESAGGRIMSVHSRRAAAPMIESLRRFPDAGVPVLHWFSGTQKELDQAIRQGCWFSVGLPMVIAKKGREIISRIPRNRLLTETDGPFAETNGTPACPWHVGLVEHALSDLWCIDIQSATALLAENLRSLRAVANVRRLPNR